jgi:hypothetical protein
MDRLVESPEKEHVTINYTDNEEKDKKKSGEHKKLIFHDIDDDVADGESDISVEELDNIEANETDSEF